MGLFSLGVSLVWIAGLRVEGAYGVAILKYTETLPAIAGTSLASEVVRGLGYWYFYGSDRLGPWKQAAVKLEESAWLLATSFAVPALGRGRRRRVALASRRPSSCSSSSSGWCSPSACTLSRTPRSSGDGSKAFMSGSSVGLALRSSDRATPLVVLGFAVLLGVGASALWSRLPAPRPWRRLRAGGPGRGQQRPVPRRRRRRARTSRAREDPFLLRPRPPTTSTPRATRRGCSSSRGRTSPPMTGGLFSTRSGPGIMTRPEILREQTIQGSYPTTDLLQAFDLTLQQGTYEPSTLAPIARLLSAGDVVLQSNLAYWRYNTPRPQETWALFDPPAKGIGRAGRVRQSRARSRPAQLQPHRRGSSRRAAERPLAAADRRVSGLATPAPSTGRSRPRRLSSSTAAEPASSRRAAAGLLDDNPTIFYAGEPRRQRRSCSTRSSPRQPSSSLTDSNRKVLERWSSVSDNIGETLPAVPGADQRRTRPRSRCRSSPTSRPRTKASLSTAEARYVTASAYGNPVSLTPEDRPAEAFDGNLETAWSVAAFSDATGNWLQVRLDHPVDHRPHQPRPGARLHRQPVDHPGDAVASTATTPSPQSLGAASRTAAGQTIQFSSRRSFTTLRITIDATTWSGPAVDAGALRGRLLRGPDPRREHRRDDPDALGPLAGARGLLALAPPHHRDDPGPGRSPMPPRSDPGARHEPDVSGCPTARGVLRSAERRAISALIPDNVIDTLLGGPDVFGGAVIGSNERLPGDLNARAVFAFDGNPKTFWSPGFDGRGPDRRLDAGFAHPQRQLRPPRPEGHRRRAPLGPDADQDHDQHRRRRARLRAAGARPQGAPIPVVSVPVSFPKLIREHDPVHDRGRAPSHDHQLVHAEARSSCPSGSPRSAFPASASPPSRQAPRSPRSAPRQAAAHRRTARLAEDLGHGRGRREARRA